jgi:hypothetical protein
MKTEELTLNRQVEKEGIDILDRQGVLKYLAHFNRHRPALGIIIPAGLGTG